MGHMVRGMDREHPPASSVMNSYRNREWWSTQQADPQRVRHRNRFYPKLMNWERDLEGMCDSDWRMVARDRGRWRQLQAHGRMNLSLRANEDSGS